MLTLSACSSDSDKVINVNDDTLEQVTGVEVQGPIGPGSAYEFVIQAVGGDKLSFVTMFIPSNDWLLRQRVLTTTLIYLSAVSR